jgi:Zn-dependent peptidase ImmA (M78 family)/DNA-binding XRE family transcriptional regulator
LNNLNALLGRKIRDARKRLRLTQKDLANRFNIPHQTISQIEIGERDLKAWELAKMAEILHLNISYLLSPFENEEPPVILWRKTPQKDLEVKEADFLKRCQQYSDLEHILGQENSQHFPIKIVNTDELSFIDIEQTALDISNELNLGSRPALSLEKTLEERYSVKVWYEDLETDGSAASTIGSFGPAILMNSKEAPWRRNYNFAHEVFHLLTWESIPAKSLKEDETFFNKIEKFANAFASYLLLPEDQLRVSFEKRIKDNRVYMTDFIEVAREFGVSTEAMLYRLLRLRIINEETLNKLRQSKLFKEKDKATMVDYWSEPAPMPERFVRLAYTAFQKGKLSRMKLAELLGESLIDLDSFLERYDLNSRENYEVEVCIT